MKIGNKQELNSPVSRFSNDRAGFPSVTDRGVFGGNINVNSLTDAAVTIAIRGASEYLTRNNFTADPEVLWQCIKSWIKIKLPEALADANQALDCSMKQVAEATFAATMIEAGIEAAKEAGFPVASDGIIGYEISAAALIAAAGGNYGSI